MLTHRMPRPTPDQTHAFRALAGRLVARRVADMGVRLWLVAMVLAACVAAFTYWQVRVPLDGTTRHSGTRGGVQRLGLVLAAFAVAGGAIAASRQAALAADPPGPEWLALPVEPAHVERHLARQARLPALAMLVPAAAAWWSGFGLLPYTWLAGLALGFALAFFTITRLACAVSLRASARASGPARRLPAAWRALVTARRAVRLERIPASPWRTRSRWSALARLDQAVSLRAGSPRARLMFSLAFLALSVAAWFMGREPLQLRAQAFAAFTIACAGLGAWAAWRAAGDPPSTLRALPLSLGDAWRGRAWPLLGVIGLVLVLHAAIPPALPPLARIGLAVTWALPALLITLLGLHLGLSLAGSPVTAENLYYGWLGAGIVASLAIPLFGWCVLLSAFAQATRRVKRWNTPEVA